MPKQPAAPKKPTAAVPSATAAPSVAPAKAPLPSVGRIVLYALEGKDRNGQPFRETRPAIVVRVWERTDGEMPLVQLQVFVDGTNDGYAEGLNVAWATSVSYDEAGAPGTWRWMPYQLGQAAKVDSEIPQLRAQIAELLAIAERDAARIAALEAAPSAPAGTRMHTIH